MKKHVSVFIVTGGLFLIMMKHLIDQALTAGTISIPSVVGALVTGLLFAGSMNALLERWGQLDNAG